ncbi:MAG TPA: Asp-tRNA(Asn)/Glu-tRNA(Gln) amidotransferase subunit GatA [Candidatus Deferrimicrobiaceae bacterium]|nr:Asp-tRNA(Asn)/Glu-tRNA(Gln) amidotransferase subunit GatA [Candidatus Deferrimicrobiaceae bacterium]
MPGIPPQEWTLLDAARAVREKEISSRELTRVLLARIERLNPAVNAYITILPEAAMRDAGVRDEELARGVVRGPLHGVPVGLKDIFCTKGIRTTCGSRILSDFDPPYDAAVTERIRDAGAVLLGKQNMDEFAMGSSTETSCFGATVNPWATDRIPGGSSGGSAAAVAAGLCYAGVGTDTGGSIRQPASLCGVVGMKPTYGRVSRYGMIAFASSLDQGGPIARSVPDAAAVLGVIAGHDRRDSTSVDVPVPDYLAATRRGVRGLKVGLPREYFAGGLDAAVRAAVEKALSALLSLGAEAVEISLPHTEYALATYYIIAPAEASSNLARYDGVRYGHRAAGAKGLIEMMSRTRAEGFGDEVKRRIMIGTYALSAGYYEAYYGKAQKVRTLLRRDFAEAFDQVDVILTPTAPTPAFRIGEKLADPLTMYLSDIYTIPCNLSGIPGISVPCGLSPEGLPIGAQLLGRHFDEEAIFAAAAAIEREIPLPRVAPLEGA